MSGGLLASKPILRRRAGEWQGAAGVEALRPGQKPAGVPGMGGGTGGSWAVGPYSWGLVGWSRESGCLSKREPQTGGIEQGGSGRVVRAAGPDTGMPPPLLFSVEKTQEGVTPQARAGQGFFDTSTCQQNDEQKSSNKPPRHEGKGAMLAISRLKYHFRRFVPPTVAGDLPCWAAPSGTYWRRFAHCPLARSSQPLHCSCPCRG